MKFSIIIPTLNEEKTIESCLSALQPLRNECEIIVVDGGSIDNTRILAAPLADKVITSALGRAKQMNNGARQATGDVLIFLHADTRLPENALQLIQQKISSASQWGRFDIQLSGKLFHVNSYRTDDELAFPVNGDCNGRSGYFCYAPGI